jgi:RNA polymerase sigma-70 factor (ECF subfamily)
MRTLPPSQLSDYCEEILARFEPLLRRVWQRVASFVTPFIEYDDFRHEVVVRLFAGLPRLNDAKAFPGFFRKMALSVATDLYRRSTRTPKIQDRVLEEIASSVDEALLTGLYVRSYLEELPPRERQVMTLAFIDGLSNRNISERTGLSEGAIRTVKHRGMSRLRSFVLRDATLSSKEK